MIVAFDLAGAVGVGGYAGYLQLTGNFHEVIAGELYRSAQPNRSDIDQAVSRHGIRTIINLRGANPGSRWYREEIAEAQRLGIAHIDFKMRANAQLTADAATKLITLMSSAPKPILIHCRSGSDRTGLAAALYLAAIRKAGEEAAEAQLSLAYGHLSVPATPAFAMDDTFEAMEPSLGYAGS